MQTPKPFRFKQFAVAQHQCAMKVNTDGVLLGAWQHGGNPQRILDIGTGTGVIALMMAQKNTSAQIDAIDIDLNAYLQAKQNFELSIWSERLNAFHLSLQQLTEQQQQQITPTLYDLIISNPPYFIDDYKTNNPQKNIAKHAVALTYTDLLKGIALLLSVNGKACIVLPAFNFTLFAEEAAALGLQVTRHTSVMAVAGKPPYLALLQLERTIQPYSATALTIQNVPGNFTDAYRTLTKDFYLKF